jgi:hypothetical protein
MYVSIETNKEFIYTQKLISALKTAQKSVQYQLLNFSVRE